MEVFTILTAGWVQTEYRAAQLMPWVLMRRGPTPPSQSIFLDYLSKWNVISLYKSLRQRHFLVSLCVAGSLILNGITVFSTGLFELDPVHITLPANLTVLKSFSGANYDPLANDQKALSACLGFAKRNLTRPAGIHDPYVYTPFLPASEDRMNDTFPTGRIYEVDLDVIKPSFDCQNASVSWEPAPATNFETDSPVYKTPDGCRWQRNSEPFDVINDESENGDTYIGLNLQIWGCQGELMPGGRKSKKPNWDIDWRLWAAVAPLNDSAGVKYHHVTVCKPHYTVYRGPVRVWRQTGESSVSTEIKTETLNVTEHIKGVQATKIMFSAFESAEQGESWNFINPKEGAYVFAANDTSWNEFWTNMTVYTNALKDSFSCMMQQVIKNDLLQDTPYHVEGTMESTEDRLFVRQMSFWLISVLLGILVAIALTLLCFFVPVAVCPRDTGSIGGVATILAQSPDFMAVFENSQFESDIQMSESKPGRTQYTTLVDGKGTFTLLPQDQPLSQATEHRTIETSRGEDSSPTWWYPFSSSWFIRIAVVVIPLAVIIGLEVVYRISTSRHGITLVDGKSPYIHYIWVYVPALVMFTIRCLFTSVEFGVRILQPYSTLRKGCAPPEISILENQLRKIGIYAVFDTLRKKQWALTAATAALLLATVNPIIVSGLFTAKVSEPTSSMNLTQTTRWNLGNPSPDKPMSWLQAATFDTDRAAGLILSLNLSDPQWTYNDLVFPQFKLATADPPPTQGFINVRIPALRSRLTCAEDPAHGGCLSTEYTFMCELNSSCFASMAAPAAVSQEVPLGYFLEGGSVGQFYMMNRSSNCPTHSLLYGKINPGHSMPREYHYIYCNASLEEVDVDTKLQLPSLSIDTDTPPRVVESSARKPFDTDAWSFPSFSNMGEKFLIQGDKKFDDPFLEAITHGHDGVPMEELLNPKRLIERVMVIYNIIVVQLLNAKARDSFHDPFNKTDFVEPATMEAPTYVGEFHDGRKYLVQNKISTRVLEAVLGGMVVCALIALCMMQTKRVIPKSPTSIAAVASFLYGSRILSSVIPHGAETCSDEELKKRGVFEGHTFSMGWWEMDEHRESDSDTSSVSNGSETGEHEDQGQVFRGWTRFGIDADLGHRPLLRNPGEV